MFELVTMVIGFGIIEEVVVPAATAGWGYATEGWAYVQTLVQCYEVDTSTHTV